MDEPAANPRGKNWFGSFEELSPEKHRHSNTNIPFKRVPLDFTQSKFSFMHIFQYLPSDHECFVYEEIFKQLDFTPLLENYSPFGQHAYHPGLISSILIYAYCHGVYTSRQIEKRCKTDLGFMFISKMNCPNFRVLSDFRKNNLAFFQDLFAQTVGIAEHIGLIDFKNVCQDGSKFEADTSKHKAMSHGRMEKNIVKLTELIKELMNKIDQLEFDEDNSAIQNEYQKLKDELQIKENRLNQILSAKKALELREETLHPGGKIPEKSQISFADIEARIMGKKGDYDYCYNGQICVDSANQVIVGQYVTQNANDKQEVAPGLECMLWATGRLPNSMSYDNGYFSGFNLEALSKYKVNAYVAVGREAGPDSNVADKSKKSFTKFDFEYCESEDVFICPDGKKLNLKSTDKEGKRTYSGIKDDCINCKYRSMCCKSKKGEPRTVSSDQYEPLRDEMREKMKQQSSKEVYSKRKVVVEPAFGQIKNKGFRRFHVRGFDKVSGEFALVCSAHNLGKVARFISRNGSNPSQLVNSTRNFGETVQKSMSSYCCVIKSVINMLIKLPRHWLGTFCTQTFLK